MMRMKIEPVTLEGHLVRLEPLSMDYVEDLYEAAQDQAIWRYMPINPGSSRADMVAWLRAALRGQEEGTDLPFVIIERATNRVVGSTRYMNISSKDRGLEIGWTWLAKEARRTGINTECKYLLLRHAFETLRAVRVQIKTDSRNEISQRAIERLGAVKEGILRNHMVLPDGYCRDSVYYSILDSEWPSVKERLEGKMERPMLVGAL
jgi:RimJ/RimL family protein N-acetyltransferase